MALWPACSRPARAPSSVSSALPRLATSAVRAWAICASWAADGSCVGFVGGGGGGGGGGGAGCWWPGGAGNWDADMDEEAVADGAPRLPLPTAPVPEPVLGEKVLLGEVDAVVFVTEADSARGGLGGRVEEDIVAFGFASLYGLRCCCAKTKML